MSSTKELFAGFTYPKFLGDLPKFRLYKRKGWSIHPMSGYRQSHPGPVESNRDHICMFYLDSDFMPGLRWDYCDKVAQLIRHTGWFTSEFQDETIRGLVFRLPHGKGYLPGWTLGESMASEIDCTTIYGCEIDCAYAADHWARQVAELEREHNDEVNDDE